MSHNAPTTWLVEYVELNTLKIREWELTEKSEQITPLSSIYRLDPVPKIEINHTYPFVCS